MNDWIQIGVDGDDPWEGNQPLLIDDKVDPENFNLESHNLESHNIMPRLTSQPL